MRDLSTGVALVLAFLVACTDPSRSEGAVTVAGRVVDAESGEPVEGVEVLAGRGRWITHADGRFTLNGVRPRSSLSFSSCSHDPLAMSVPDAGASSLSVELTPSLTKVVVVSNLTGRPIQARLLVEDREIETGSGPVTISGLCPADLIVARAKGYEGAQAEPDEDGTVRFVLEAEPTTTAAQWTAWNATRNVDRLWSWVHPDAQAYITKAEFVRDLRRSIAAGYRYVDVDVKGVTFTNWVFPECSATDFGGKRYLHTAVVRKTDLQTTPGGGVTSSSGFTHYVQTNDGRWRWFPEAGCDYAVT
jgi:hypothetical protein